MSGDYSKSRHVPGSPASKVNGSFLTNQPHTYQQTNVVQHNGTYHQFNPTQASFMPAGPGMELQQASRALHAPSHHNELVSLVNNNRIQQLTETVRLDQAYRGLAQDVHDIRSSTESDLKAIKEQLLILSSPQATSTMQKQIELSKSAETSTKAEADYDYYWTNADCCPSEEMLRALPKERIAKSYLDEAETREVSATSLRKQAFELCPELQAGQASTSQLKIEAAPILGTNIIIPGFACCNTEYSAIGELVEHVERTHTAPEHRLLNRARSKAVEIKSPENDQAEPPHGDLAVSPAAEVKKQENSPWIPFAVRNMPLVALTIPGNMETFSFEFIRATFGGEWWSPGYYFVHHDSILPSKAYWILDVAHEPFLPAQPGAHGAKLTAFFNETVSGAGEAPEVENYLDVPVFIKTSDKDEYSYFGNYSQLRFSDKLGYDIIASIVPKSVLRNHAEQLAEIGRPAWVTQALKEHFWPKPKYDGPIPTDSAIGSPTSTVRNDSGITTGQERRVMKALVEYAAELKDWEKDSNFKVNLLTAESIFDSFGVADADAEPGLRLFWEYLQCVNWDAKFYNMLVVLKGSSTTKLDIGDAGKKRRPSPERNDGSTAAKLGLSSEDTYKPMKAKTKAVFEDYPGPEAKTKFVRPDFNDQPVRSGGVRNGGMANGAAVPPTGPRHAPVKKNGELFVPPHLRGRR